MKPLILIAGPCAIEDDQLPHRIADEVNQLARSYGMRYIFKGSYKKANRSRLDSFTGIGDEKALTILKEVGLSHGIQTITDIHESHEAVLAAQYVDHLQIPAFLCRQTDLLLAAGESGAAINIKKGQFLAPWDMENVATKVASTGNKRILLCERGTSFGYNMLVSDMRSLPIMGLTDYPVVFDATHSVQLPGGQGTSSGGQRQFVAPLARAAVAVGSAAIFIETHQDPDNAPSDGPNMLPISQMPEILTTLKEIDTVRKAISEI